MDSIDFLPEHLRAQRARRRRLVCQAWLLVVVAGLVAAWAWSWQGRIRVASAELDALRDRSANNQRQIAQRAELEQQRAELLIKERINTTLGSRVDALDLLGELERLMPRGVSLLSLNMEAVQMRMPAVRALDRSGSARAVAAAAPEVNVNRVRLLITGLAPSDVDVANFIAQLSASGLLEDVNMGYTRDLTLQGRKGREFQVSCYVVR